MSISWLEISYKISIEVVITRQTWPAASCLVRVIPSMYNQFLTSKTIKISSAQEIKTHTVYGRQWTVRPITSMMTTNINVIAWLAYKLPGCIMADGAFAQRPVHTTNKVNWSIQNRRVWQTVLKSFMQAHRNDSSLLARPQSYAWYAYWCFTWL